ncbi:hypothetical protein M438DRAFT_367628 [Aureobasidium pullulans EXF-150]|uniref:BTB domain-containing protein n=1 Tax=Aureobasidium pullulans EXF-150 TaxID=1043002 RepID=A0A074XI89_AURPU|nr:uncharacterized protein M438DRAFT_367628 [Aureobasidium pullulans EXF-150]KEQ81747.1 hypothetical protein M438DRAFT_367628 [Aureobasidium pullulans EXF-150]
MTTPPDKSHIGDSAGKAVSTPNRLPSKKHYKNTVVLSVGPSKQEFTVHKELLCFYSDFFRAAFNGSFKEATEGRIELPDAQVDVFESFQVWLYSRSLLNTEDLQDQPDYQKYPSFSALARLWVFGDKYQIPLLQNCVIDSILEKQKQSNRFNTCIVRIAYQDTIQESPLRRLAIDISVFRMTLLSTLLAVSVKPGILGTHPETFLSKESAITMFTQRASIVDSSTQTCGANAEQ